MGEGLLTDLLDNGHKWLYRGVPAECSEVDSVRDFGEVDPPYPGRIGEGCTTYIATL